MSEWKSVTVADIAASKGLVGGPFGSSLVSKDYVAAGVPVIRGVNLGSDQKFDGTEFVFVSPEKVERDLSRNLAEPGDVIFTQRGTLGQVGVVPHGRFDRYVVSQSQMRLRVNREIVESEFVYYYFRSPGTVAAIQNHAITTGVPHINLGILGAMEIPLPPLVVQRGICQVLGALDDKIAANKRIAKTAEELTLALVHEAIWPIRTELGALVEHVRKQVAPESLNVASVAHYSLPAFDSARLPEIVHPGSIKSGKFVVREASVLLSKLNPTIPRVWNVRPSSGMPALASTEFLVLKPASGVTTHEIWAVCSASSVRERLAGKATGTSNSHQRVKPADVLAIEVVDPRAMSDEVRGQVAALCQRAAQARFESQSLSTLRDTLLPKLMTGVIKIRDAERGLNAL